MQRYATLDKQTIRKNTSKYLHREIEITILSIWGTCS